MLTLPPSTKIFFCSQSIDMRLSFDGLSGMVQSHFGMNPLCGQLFIFLSKRGNCMKVLFWNIDGFVLYYKRLKRGTFSWVKNIDSENDSEILASDFSLLLAGINPTSGISEKRYHRLPEPIHS